MLLSEREGMRAMLDTIDRMLLGLLKKDAHSKYAALGEAVHLSPPTVHERVKKLERKGIIRRYSAEIDPHALGLDVAAFVRIMHRTTCQTIAQELKHFIEIEECHSIAGEDSLLLKIRTANTADLEALLNRIRQIDGVERTFTSIVLLTHFERGVNFLEEE